MTVIAWDGKTLAADRRGCIGSLHITNRKIFRLNDGTLFTGAGIAGHVLEMREWMNGDRDRSDFPQYKPSAQDDWEPCINITPTGIYLYERVPTPIHILDKTFAMGSGRDYAMAAMSLGKSAKEAVKVACKFDPGCGNGIDTLEL